MNVVTRRVLPATLLTSAVVMGAVLWNGREGAAPVQADDRVPVVRGPAPDAPNVAAYVVGSLGQGNGTTGLSAGPPLPFAYAVPHPPTLEPVPNAKSGDRLVGHWIGEGRRRLEIDRTGGAGNYVVSVVEANAEDVSSTFATASPDGISLPGRDAGSGLRIQVDGQGRKCIDYPGKGLFCQA